MNVLVPVFFWLSSILPRFRGFLTPTSCAAALQARLPEGQEIDAVAFYKNMYAKMDELEMNRKFTSPVGQ